MAKLLEVKELAHLFLHSRRAYRQAPSTVTTWAVSMEGETLGLVGESGCGKSCLRTLHSAPHPSASRASIV